MRLFTVAFLNITLLAFFYRRSFRYLQIFQQEQYDNNRFKNWFFSRKAFDRSATLVLLIVSLLVLFTKSVGRFKGSVILILGSLLMGLRAWREEDPRFSGKVRLKMTERAKRIHNVAFAIYIAALLIVDL